MRSTVAVLLALAVGIASGYWGYAPEAPTPPRIDRNTWELPAEAPQVETSTDPLAGVEASEGEFADLRAALAAIPQLPPVRGSEAITVIVKTPDGEPVAGASITATPRGFRSTPESERTGTWRIEDLVRRALWESASRRLGVSGENGETTLSDLGDARYLLRAACPGHKFNDPWKVAGVGERVEWTATPICTIEVRVVAPDGSKAREANLEVRNGGRRTTWEWTADKRIHTATPGRLRIVAKGGPWGELSSDPVERDVFAQATPTIVTLHLNGRRGVVGKVVFEQSGATDDLEVYLQPDRGNGVQAPHYAKPQGQHVDFDPASPVFRFFDVAPGNYFVLLSADELVPPLASARVTVGDKLVRQDLTVEAPRVEQFLAIEVYDPDGVPLDGATFRYALRAPGWSLSRSPVFAYRVGSGRYHIAHVFPKGAEGHPATIGVSHARHGSVSFEYQLPRSQPMIVRFRKLHPVKVSVEGFAESGYAGRVLAFLESPRDPQVRRTSFDYSNHNYVGADGNFGWNAAAGDWDVWLYAKDGLWPLAHQRIRVEDGGGDFRMKFPELHSVRVEADEPADNATIDRVGSSPWGMEVRISLPSYQRKIAIELLPAGIYEIRVDDGTPQTVTVPTDGPVRCSTK